MEQLQENIQELLHRLGATENYTGYQYMVQALLLCLENPNRLQMITKWLYPDVAKRYKTTWTAVERNIRTLGRVIWRENQPLLEILARKPLSHQPSVAQLLSILSYNLRVQFVASSSPLGQA